MPKRLTPQQRADRHQAKKDALDKRVLSIFNKHGLQRVMESIKRVVEATGNEQTNGHQKFIWDRALTIVKRADESLYGQHCGDIPPEWARTK